MTEVIRWSDREVIGHLRKNSFHGLVGSEAGLLCAEAGMRGEEVEVVSVDYSLNHLD